MAAVKKSDVIPRHITSSPHLADDKGKRFRRPIPPLCFIVIVLMFFKLRRWLYVVCVSVRVCH